MLSSSIGSNSRHSTPGGNGTGRKKIKSPSASASAGKGLSMANLMSLKERLDQQQQEENGGFYAQYDGY